MTTRVLKIGGHQVDDAAFLTGLGEVVAGLEALPVIVHGGGKEIAALQRRLGLQPRFIEGLRVTDEESLAVAEMVLSGRVNKRLVVALLRAGVQALGLSGVDLGLVRVERLTLPGGDLGRVGRPVAVRAEVLRTWLERGIVPVLSPISLGADGPYNVNADQVAAAVAVALKAEEMVFVTDVPGVLMDGTLLPELTPAQARRLIEQEVIAGGMVPKVRAALEGLEQGVRQVRITNLDGLRTGQGTRVTPQPGV